MAVYVFFLYVFRVFYVFYVSGIQLYIRSIVCGVRHKHLVENTSWPSPSPSLSSQQEVLATLTHSVIHRWFSAIDDRLRYQVLKNLTSHDSCIQVAVLRWRRLRLNGNYPSSITSYYQTWLHMIPWSTEHLTGIGLALLLCYRCWHCYSPWMILSWLVIYIYIYTLLIILNSWQRLC